MNYYEFLGPMAEEIEHLIYRFFEEHVQENFDNNNCRYLEIDCYLYSGFSFNV
jgi:hypothetical protein